MTILSRLMYRLNGRSKLDRVESEFVYGGYGLIRIRYSAHGYEFNGWVVQSKDATLCYKIGKLEGDWPIETNASLNILEIFKFLRCNKYKQIIRVPTRVSFIDIFYKDDHSHLIIDRGNIDKVNLNPLNDLLIKVSQVFPYEIKLPNKSIHRTAE